MELLVENANKTIRGRRILCDVNLELSGGNIYGFIGRNGSGKTMLFRALSGLIHFTNTRRGGEIRHLALRPQDRGRGLSRALIAGCLRALEGGACTVWTGADNRPALGAYQSMGFQADGWRSAVLIRP